ncbi:DJ-1/YajL/PfpI superfamily, includes chaperone protein YajL (former ThiJ), parkinsonism-associated protein DJ-1, peptidases PfpI, Hsp31 [hydrothermal vent metagenome]|uniref:DJ-1/YajL/PfpI superfamily, includes chaperone protein YajL (Former ThiJ), parkinsonism-associated protein DJ-1, peptidases PfpI, Hsp31 n=1 Tax=hydrothermal vent metagenome TaxID=652676 RepID=A0A3B0XEA8_9ZZZZ
MKRVLIPLAQGCEELEAITISDLLTRAGIDVVTCGLDEQSVVASRGTTIIPKTVLKKVANELFDMLVLPGGMPGAKHLRDNVMLQTCLKNHANNNRYIAAICAAPKALAAAGLLKNKTVTCFPGALDDAQLENTTITSNAIEIDHKIITSRGPGTAIDFALMLIELLEGKQKSQEVEMALQR